jgi:hypothetical protein
LVDIVVASVVAAVVVGIADMGLVVVAFNVSP